uniref:Uncharacterized protein n=1 Tax=Panagrolaimus sp. JU765 TaxID=591449 RepID=A0AC34R1Q1_9BILA
MEIEDIIQAMPNPSTVRILSMVADEKVLDVMAAKSSETNPIVEFIVATYCHFNIEHVKKFLQTATFAPTCTLAIKFDGLKKEVMEMLLSVGEICPNDNPRYVILKMNGSTIQINRPIGDNDAYQPLPNGEVDDGTSDDENDEVDSDDPNNYQDAE